MSIDFRRQRLRGRFEAWLLARVQPLADAGYGARLAAEIGGMTGTVVELGPGTGANMQHYPPGVRVIAIEPNPAMHARLAAEAVTHGVDLEIREMRGEAVDVADGAADHVVGTLLLCGVDDQAAVLREVRRVLRPSGTYVFVEHIAAPPRSRTARVQRLAKRPHRWLFNGCEVDRDTVAQLRAAGFSEVAIENLDLGLRAAYVRTMVVGTATR